MTTDTDWLVPKVREAMRAAASMAANPRPAYRAEFFLDAIAALDALATRLKACEEREALNLEDDTGVRAMRLLEGELEKRDARIEAQSAAIEDQGRNIFDEGERRRAAEARLDKALAALRLLRFCPECGHAMENHPTGCSLGRFLAEMP